MRETSFKYETIMPDEQHMQVFVPKGKYMVNPMKIQKKFDFLFKQQFLGHKKYLQA